MLVLETTLLCPFLMSTLLLMMLERQFIMPSMSFQPKPNFAIRYGVGQAIQISEATCIIVIMDAIHAAECIFDSS